MSYAFYSNMREFIVVGHKARTDGNFNLNDLPGSGGRIDILCRCVNSALFLSHDLRRDVTIYLVLLGEPDMPRIVKFDGKNVRYLNPDERSSGSLIKKALEKSAIPRWRESTRGVWIRLGGLADLLDEVLTEEKSLFYLQEGGGDIRDVFKENVPENNIFVLGDHTGMTPEEETVIQDSDAKTISVGPISLHADHCIILVNNEIDRTPGMTG